ncbi:MAG: hypothetical protein KAQ83_00435 [Nanoarchaeota archaeon]|nr:hypothetical protein [Nanoarchaeota archaeon]
MKKELLGLIFVIFLTTFAINDPMGLGNIRYDENPAGGFVHTNVDNRGNYFDADEVAVNVFFPDLGLMMHSNNVDINSGETKVLRTFLDDIPSGEHMVRVCAHNDDGKSCVYRYWDII